MALTPEDKKDVKGAMGKALANKVSKVTRDGGPLGTAKRHLRADRASGHITRGGEKTLHDIKALPGSGRTQEIANRVKATADKSSGQTKAGAKMVTVFGRTMREGSKKHQIAMDNKRHYDDLSSSER